MSHAETLPSSVTHTAAARETVNRRPRRVLRRIGAVAAGLAAIFAATTATDLVLHATGVFPPYGAPPMSDALFLLAFAYRFVFDVGGCWLTARLAPDRPMGHALALGTIGLLLSVAGAVAMWSAGTHWYPVALAASALPSAWLGGRLRVRVERSAASPRGAHRGRFGTL